MIHPYGVLVSLGLGAMLAVLAWVQGTVRLRPVHMDTLLLWMVGGALVGARIYHVLTDWPLYVNASVLDFVAIWNGGIGFLGALIGGFLGLGIGVVALHPSKRLQWFFTYSDLVVIGIPLGQAIGRVGNYVNQELYGLPTTLPWGILIDGQRYHPLFAYEALGNLVLFGILLVLVGRKAFVVGKGQYTCLYLALYACLRFWLEFLRLDTATPSGLASVFSVAQWICLVGMGVGSVCFWLRRHAPAKAWDWSFA